MASDKQVICAHLAGIEVVGDLTPLKDSETQPDHFAIIYVDEKDVVESDKKPAVPSPRWEWQEDRQLRFHPSSTIKIMLYRKSSNLVTKHLVGQHTRKAVELLQNDMTLDLKDETGATITCRIKIKLSSVPEPELNVSSMPEPELNGKSSINLSIEQASTITSPSAAKLLCILTMLPAGIRVDDLATMTPSISNINEITGMLTDMSLASVRQGERIELLSPVKAHLLNYQQLDDDTRRHIYFYHFKLVEQGLRKPGDSLFSEAIQKLVEHQRNIESVLMDALENGCIPAIEATLQYSSPRCAIKPRMDILERAVKTAVAEETSKPGIIAREDGTMALTARCMQRLGEMRIESGIYKESCIKDINFEMDYFAQAMERFEKIGDSNAIAYCQFYVAERIWINDANKAIQHLEKTRDDFIAMGDAAGAVKCELQLGDHYLGPEIHDAIPKAFGAFHRALAQSNDAYHRALCNQLLSRIYARNGRMDDAHSLLDTALKACQDFGDRAAVAMCLESMANFHIQSHRHDDARAALRQAIAEYTWLGRDLKAAFCQWRLGNMCDNEEAVELCQKAIPQFHASRFVFADAECRWHLGRRYMQMGRFSDALLHLEMARHQLVLNGTPSNATMCLIEILQSMCSDGNNEGAQLVLEENIAEMRAFLVQQGNFPGIREEDLKLTIDNGKLAIHKPSDDNDSAE